MAGKIKTLFDAAKKLEKGASRRVGAAGNKGVRIEPGSKVGSAVGGIKDPKTGKVLKKDKIKDLTSKGRRRIAGTAAAGAAASTLSGGTKDKKKDYTKGVSKGGVPFKEAFRKARADGKKTFEWNGNDYTTKLASEKASNKSSDKKSESTSKSTTKKRGAVFGKDAKFRPFGGVLARALLGDDEKFGGERGLIDFVRTKKKPVKKQAGGMMKAKGHKRGGAVGMSKPGNEKLPMVGKKRPMSRAQSRATLSPAQRRLLDSVQGREGSKQATSVIQDLSDKYGYAPGKRAGAKGGMGKGKRAKPGGMNMGGAVGMKPIDTKKLGALPPRPSSVANAGAKAAADAKAAANASAQAQGGPGSARSLANLAAMTRGMNRGPNRPKPTKATAMRGAAARRSGGSTPPGMRMGGAAMKSKMASKGGKMGGKVPPGYKNGGSVGRKKTARGVGAAKRGFGKAMR